MNDAVGTVRDNCYNTEAGPYTHGEGRVTRFSMLLLSSLTRTYQSLTSSSLTSLVLVPASPYQWWRRDAKGSAAACEHSHSGAARPCRFTRARG